VSCLVVTALAFVIVLLLVLPTLPGVLDRTHNEQGQLRWVLTTLGASVTISAIGNSITPTGAIAVQPVISGSFTLLGANVPYYDVVVVGVMVLVVAASDLVIAKTQVGRQLRAVASDRYGAEVIGIPSRRFIVAIFVVAGLFSALAGILIAPITQADATTGFSLGIAGFAAATAGGLGEIRGSVIGGLIVGFAELFGTRFLNSQLESVYPLLVLIIVLMVRPRGILQSAFVERV
jgi:branched-chain amino acid transport system permease protein